MEETCAACRRRTAGRPAPGPCRRCGRRRTLEPATQRCRPCFDPAMAEPLAAGSGCGALAQWARGMCKACYEHSPHTVETRAASWAGRLPQIPSWWGAFTAHLATHRHAFYAADTVAHTARLILDTGTADPRTLLSHARGKASWLGRPLSDFFHAQHLLEGPGEAEEARAAARRERRVQAVPARCAPPFAASPRRCWSSVSVPSCWGCGRIG